MTKVWIEGCRIESVERDLDCYPGININVCLVLEKSRSIASIDETKIKDAITKAVGEAVVFKD